MAAEEEKELIYRVEKLLPTTVVVNVKKSLAITEDLDTEVDRAASVYGYYAILAEKSETKYQRIKLGIETWEAETKARKDRECATAQEKKLTESQMNAYIKSQVKYKAFRLKMIELQEQKRILKVLAFAFEKKADLVQTKSANRRKEHK